MTFFEVTEESKDLLKDIFWNRNVERCSEPISSIFF